MRRLPTVALVVLIIGGFLARADAPSAAQPRKLKVHISVDMEGVAGTVTGDQLGPAGFEYGRFREFMTREALAAVEAARAAGATEVVVADSHGNGENLLHRAVPRRRARDSVVAAPPRHGRGHRRPGRRRDLHRLSRRHEQPGGRARAHVLERQPHARRAERHEHDRRIVERRHRRPLQRPHRDDVRRRCRDRGGAEGRRQHRGGGDEAEPRVSLRADDHATGVVSR